MNELQGAIEELYGMMEMFYYLNWGPDYLCVYVHQNLVKHTLNMSAFFCI